MISYYLGIPGSGKTYRAVDIIFNNFSNSKYAKRDLKKDYNNCYTNINEFKFNLLNNVNELDLDILDSHIMQLHRLYKKKVSDAELIELCIELDIYKTLFVIDEAQNEFGTRKPHFVWWLTYHRHLFHDIILITQSLSLIDSKYKSLAEIFYKAKPNSLILFSSSFKYTGYIDSRLSLASKSSVVSVKKRKEVFKLYQSGDSIESKNILLHFLSISGVFLLIFFIFGYLFYSYMSPDTVSDKPQYIPHVAVVDNSKAEVSINRNERVYKRIFCSLSECSIDEITFPINVFNKLFEPYNIEVLDRKVMIQDFKEIHILIDNNYNETFLIDNKKDEKSDSDFSFINFNTSDKDN